MVWLRPKGEDISSAGNAGLSLSASLDDDALFEIIGSAAPNLTRRGAPGTLKVVSAVLSRGGSSLI
jgi:hypothetical protein